MTPSFTQLRDNSVQEGFNSFFIIPGINKDKMEGIMGKNNSTHSHK